MVVDRDGEGDLRLLLPDDVLVQDLLNLPGLDTGKDVETVTADCERDNFMTAEEAREYGLIDKVIYTR